MKTYAPKPGDQVRVRRYAVPTPELPGLAERKMIAEHTGTVGTVRKRADGVLFQLEGFGHDIFTGYQFSGRDRKHGVSWSLHTEVVLLADVATHDQAGLEAQVALAEREKAAALAEWERACDAEALSRQWLTGAQERLERALRKAAVGQAG
jgi:hypothetical protein